MNMRSPSTVVTEAVKSGEIPMSDLIKVLDIINKCRLAQTSGELVQVAREVQQFVCDGGVLNACGQSCSRCSGPEPGTTSTCGSGASRCGGGHSDSRSETLPESFLSTQIDDFVFDVNDSSYIICHYFKSEPRAMCLTGKTGQTPIRRENYLLMTYLMPHFHETYLRVHGIVSNNCCPQQRQAEHNAGDFTDREREVLQWLTRGKTNWEIGTILGISERTVKFHLNHIFQKLGATNRAQAVMKASTLGLLGARMVSEHD
jgi:DNA-binding CsgD family transcriptional regulator